MPLPDYIDNTQHTLEAILRELIQTQEQTTLDIATGFFRIEAWVKLEHPLNRLTHLRLLIGRDPSIQPAERSYINLQKVFQKDIQTQLEQTEFNLAYKEQIDRLIAYLSRETVEVRLYGGKENTTASFLHAKAYIFDDYSIIGSSNFTPSGLEGNTELNVLIKQSAIARDLRNNWFAKFWNHESVDTEYKQKLINILEASKFGSRAYTPYQVFVKALYELFKEETTIDEHNRTTLELANFQQQGFEQAVRLINRHHACMIADAVGLGKTYIALRLMEYYLTQDRRPGHVPRALVICPAQLRDLVWRKKLDEFGIKADIVSQEEIARTGFEIRNYTKHDIIVVDESHNFRNSGTNRYNNLQKILASGKRDKKVILLTATPINNSIFDLYHQFMLMARNNPNYYREWGISNLTSFFKALNRGQIEITELLFLGMVRRSRLDVIKRQKAGEPVVIDGKEVRFPQRQLEKFTYNFEENYAGLYARLAEQIDQLHLAPYNINSFKLKLNSEEQAQMKRNEALVALMKTLWLKRLESSLVAFQNSIENQRKFQTEFNECLSSGKLLDTRTFRKILTAEIDEQEIVDLNALIESLQPVDPKKYNISELQKQIHHDFTILENITNTLTQIRQGFAQGLGANDKKLESFKNLLTNQLQRQKIIIFSYFKDTAKYLYNELITDKLWLQNMGSPKIDLITGDTKGKERADKVKRFSPHSNCESDEEIQECLANPIDILICTDVLSEGQNLQDAGVLVNYDLHWNPVRMIQRAGRIDRIGTTFETLYIYNCFPEEGLEKLLGLVERLQQRIATIDREVGLDGSVLGEAISERSLEELRKLKQADTDAEKAIILEELEGISELISLDEMRLPLAEFLNQRGSALIEEIPMGIHSTRDGREGLFLAFQAKGRTAWYFYPRIDGNIVTDRQQFGSQIITDKRRIFKMLQCTESDYPDPDTLPPVPFNKEIFTILEGAIQNVINDFRKQAGMQRIKPKLSKVLQQIALALEANNSFQDETDQEQKERVFRIITTSENLRVYEPDIKQIWEDYRTNHRDDINWLSNRLDEYFIENEIGQDLLDSEPTMSEFITKEDVQLVCYEWFE